MRRIATLSAGLLFLVVLTASLPVGAYVDVGYDAEDQPDSYYDIRSTVRRVQPTQGVRRLKLVVRIYDGERPLDQLDYVWTMEVRLDAQRGLAYDAVLRLWSYDMAGSGCDLETRRGRHLRSGSLGTGPDFAWCWLPVSPLHPDKRIRWSVEMLDSGDSVVDVAPDVGMYA